MKEKENTWLRQPDKIGMGNLKLSTVCEMHPKGSKWRSLHQVADFLQHRTIISRPLSNYK